MTDPFDNEFYKLDKTKTRIYADIDTMLENDPRWVINLLYNIAERVGREVIITDWELGDKRDVDHCPHREDWEKE